MCLRAAGIDRCLQFLVLNPQTVQSSCASSIPLLEIFAEQRIRASYDRISPSASLQDQKTKDQGTKKRIGPKDQATQGSRDQGTS